MEPLPQDRPDWPGLPIEILRLIFEHVYPVQRRRARLMCRAWAAAICPEPAFLDRQQDITVAEGELLARLPTLSVLRLMNARSIHAIALVTQISALTLEGTSKINLKPLQHLPSLASLELLSLSQYGSGMTVADLLPLTALTSLLLQKVYVQYLADVAELTQLQRLTLLDVELEDELERLDVWSLSKMVQLHR